MKIAFARIGILFALFLLASCTSTLPLASSGQSPSGREASPSAEGTSAAVDEDAKADDDGLPSIAQVEGTLRLKDSSTCIKAWMMVAYLRIPTDSLDRS